MIGIGENVFYHRNLLKWKDFGSLSWIYVLQNSEKKTSEVCITRIHQKHKIRYMEGV